MSQDKEKLEFVALLAQEVSHLHPFAVADLAKNLMRQGKRHSNLAVALCNGAIDQETFERRAVKVRKRASDFVNAFKIKVIHQNDPRGATLRLALPSKRTNTFDGESWSIPGS